MEYIFFTDGMMHSDENRNEPKKEKKRVCPTNSSKPEIIVNIVAVVDVKKKPDEEYSN